MIIKSSPYSFFFTIYYFAFLSFCTIFIKSCMNFFFIFGNRYFLFLYSLIVEESLFYFYSKFIGYFFLFKTFFIVNSPKTIPFTILKLTFFSGFIRFASLSASAAFLQLDLLLPQPFISYFASCSLLTPSWPLQPFHQLTSCLCSLLIRLTLAFAAFSSANF
ncbi:MAG: hypothetical protein CM15mP106_3930 [Candidatus Neomarinimicrobiota bacterium]|nr:MAG: hypothetical protein CM15mP106_3930 [Candidatus Neomarinimicrobiota bacterium]